MDVSEQGLSLLWLRILARPNPLQRERMTTYFNRWVKQVKLSEKALGEAGLAEDIGGPDDRLV